MAGDRAGYWIALCLLGGCSDGRSLVIGDDLAVSNDLATSTHLASSVDLAVSLDAIPGENSGAVDAGLDLTTDDIYGNPPDCPQQTACVDQCGSCANVGESCIYFELVLTCDPNHEWRCAATGNGWGPYGCPHYDLSPPDDGPPDLAPYASCPPKAPWGAPCTGRFYCDYGLDEDSCECNGGPLFVCVPGRPPDFAVLRLDLSVQD